MDGVGRRKSVEPYRPYGHHFTCCQKLYPLSYRRDVDVVVPSLPAPFGTSTFEPS